MTPERWETIQALIREKYTVEYHGAEDTEDMQGVVEVLECDGPIGTLRFEYTAPTTLRIFVWNDEEHDWMVVDDRFIQHL